MRQCSMSTINVPLNEFIMDKIREDILNNKYKIGHRLKESVLSKEFNVSRTPVREALKQLCIEGLTESIPNIGVVVTGVSDQDARDIAETMVAIEVASIERAVENCTPLDLHELREVYDLMEFYYMKGNIPKVLELDTKFHWKIYELSQSRLIEKLLKDFHMLMKTYRKFSIHLGNRVQDVIIEHKNILEALDKKDVEALKFQVSAHRESFRKALSI